MSFRKKGGGPWGFRPPTTDPLGVPPPYDGYEPVQATSERVQASEGVAVGCGVVVFILFTYIIK
jgi:hypothetical protein